MMTRAKLSVLLICVVIIIGGFAVFSWYEHGQTQHAINDEPHSTNLETDKIIFEPVLPNNSVVLPRDFKFHPEFQHEWWHYFANVADESGEQYNIQWSYFRIASDDRTAKGWLNPQIYVSHVVISSADKVWREQRISRGGIGQAGFDIKPFKLWIDNWSWRSLGVSPLPGILDIATDTFSLSLQSVATGSFILPGEDGYQSKHNLQPIASYNLRSPSMTVKGQLTLEGLPQTLKVSGSAWLSKEWGNNLLPSPNRNWDRFVFNIDGQNTLVVNRYRLYQKMPYVTGTLIQSSGKIIMLSEDDIVVSPVAASASNATDNVPRQWIIKIPKYDMRLVIEAVNSNMGSTFFIPYWEGPVRVNGNSKIAGFMQLTGY
ncbi:lipocalin-like domain-containing protein [Vibrio aestuarianus]|uniref:Carotenoid 1,2-hydratase n=1 Tax=Vibrio aestuarianus TaxID=28171 RepID=A0A9X4FCJ0_9VIBR|nr:lipocalin-like domain-containing protein [Vibrio aestuarianus]MDE1236407.1 carotenoid 1,2-hydratase [Vibrio aestuarianus]MDE1247285.1 carotenoid 1,2-hydratase [Vibrio aestuarianus]MDE1347725.1 carotenoid 1,2-hydratase [Vibrio aestuarianus]